MANQSSKHRKFLATSLTAAMVASAVAPTAGFAAEAKSFKDVPADHWAKASIDYLVGKGAIDGRPGGTFDLKSDITRGEAAKILSITLGLKIDDEAKASFKDAADHWASKYIAALQTQKEGVINGYDKDTFKPNAKITRQEMAKMVVTAYGLKLNENADVSFTDNNGWGAEFVNILASLGVVEGVAAGKFSPNEL
ncbi:S-layer homology domain-containing protein [Cytobacillus depressus]|uniref:S-layer homology domain-containing protein n=1 Tax=Cytobacillus depressus TaxID=1602942 RepID=A0A6L3V8T6_9BACI|nr:S-layer homology domain-containing protein [Cytobacillus depressus]KAB2336755.1 S-layer homology domain-containing protein [Cytobacillus depressus]